MKVYDYNQEFGGNYYQPMIQYINHKDTYGPFHTKADVYLPHTAEVRSNKYTNMRYQDKSSAKHNLDEFLVNAHAKQIKELNGTTANVHYNQLHDAVGTHKHLLETPYSDSTLLGLNSQTDRLRRHYLSELSFIASRDKKTDNREFLNMGGEFLLDQIKQRNRMHSLRQDTADSNRYYFGNSDDEDPLPYDVRQRLESARAGLRSLLYEDQDTSY